MEDVHDVDDMHQCSVHEKDILTTNTNVGLKFCNFICQKRLIKPRLELVKTKFARYIYYLINYLN